MVFHRIGILSCGEGVSSHRLTPRELEALLWAARGKSVLETAQLLGLSERTVKFHIQRACAKLDARTKTHAVARVLAQGLIQP